MDADFIFAAVADERRRMADLIDRLDDDALSTPSLCSGWTIKTVAAHLVSVFADSFWKFQYTALRQGGLHRAINELARRRAEAPAAEIAATLRARADHRLSPPVNGPVSGLADVLTHRGDMQIPLGLPFEPDRQKVALALDFLTGPRPLGFVPRRRLKGICLHANDIDRVWGSGDQIYGPAPKLMLAVMGRSVVLPELEGPGIRVLEERLKTNSR